MEQHNLAWTRYVQLMAERPALFRQSDELQIITDKQAADEFMKGSGKTIGVVYESPYSLMLVDLVVDKSGRKFAYERLVPVNTGAIVSVPVYEGKFILLRQFRHALRSVQLAFPRGFGELGLSPEQNLRKEILEEIGADVLRIEHIGKITPDSGITSSIVDVYFCEVSTPALMKDHEGIQELSLMTPEEFEKKIHSGEVTDGFSLAAYSLYTAAYGRPVQ